MEIRKDNHIENAGLYLSGNLKRRLMSEFKGSLTFWPQQCGSDYVFSSNLNVADALTKIKVFEGASETCVENVEEQVMLRAASILRRDTKSCKKNLSENDESGLEISHAQASSIIPNNMFNFCAALLSEDVLDHKTKGKLTCKPNHEHDTLIYHNKLCMQYVNYHLHFPLEVLFMFTMRQGAKILLLHLIT